MKGRFVFVLIIYLWAHPVQAYLLLSSRTDATFPDTFHVWVEKMLKRVLENRFSLDGGVQVTTEQNPLECAEVLRWAKGTGGDKVDPTFVFEGIRKKPNRCNGKELQAAWIAYGLFQRARGEQRLAHEAFREAVFLHPDGELVGEDAWDLELEVPDLIRIKEEAKGNKTCTWSVSNLPGNAEITINGFPFGKRKHFVLQPQRAYSLVIQKEQSLPILQTLSCRETNYSLSSSDFIRDPYSFGNSLYFLWMCPEPPEGIFLLSLSGSGLKVFFYRSNVEPAFLLERSIRELEAWMENPGGAERDLSLSLFQSLEKNRWKPSRVLPSHTLENPQTALFPTADPRPTQWYNSPYTWLAAGVTILTVIGWSHLRNSAEKRSFWRIRLE